jgi:hypothetical protein
LKEEIAGMVLVALAAPQHDIIVVWFLIDIVRKGCGGNGSLHGSSSSSLRVYHLFRFGWTGEMYVRSVSLEEELVDVPTLLWN